MSLLVKYFPGFSVQKRLHLVLNTFFFKKSEVLFKTKTLRGGRMEGIWDQKKDFHISKIVSSIKYQESSCD